MRVLLGVGVMAASLLSPSASEAQPIEIETVTVTIVCKEGHLLSTDVDPEDAQLGAYRQSDQQMISDARSFPEPFAQWQYVCDGELPDRGQGKDRVIVTLFVIGAALAVVGLIRVRAAKSELERQLRVARNPKSQ